jgi:hypothetical protein
MKEVHMEVTESDTDARQEIPSRRSTGGDMVEGIHRLNAMVAAWPYSGAGRMLKDAVLRIVSVGMQREQGRFREVVRQDLFVGCLETLETN